MDLVHPERGFPYGAVPRLNIALVVGASGCLYLAGLSGFAYWLDSTEFVAAASWLGIPHPPGSPLSVLFQAAALQLPLGSQSFRAAIPSAVFGALAVGAFASWVKELNRIPEADAFLPWFAGLLALTPAFWFQSVRPEVYSLQAFLGFLLLLVGTKLLNAPQPSAIGAVTRVGQLGWLCGLGASNHHFLTLVTATPLLVVLGASVPAIRHVRAAFAFFLAASLGALPYAYVPLRALADPPLNLGEPNTLSRFLWVLRAQAFQKNTGDGVPGSFVERLADVGVALGQAWHPLVLVLALAGLYLLIRMRPKPGFLLLATLLTGVCARAWLGFVPNNPDALGYLMIPTGILLVLAGLLPSILAFRLAARLSVLRSPVLPTRVSLILATLFAVALGGFAWHRWSTLSLQSFSDTDTFADAEIRRLPPRSVVWLYQPQSVFALWHVSAVEHARPDIVWIPVPFVTYPGMPESLVNDAPWLTSWLKEPADFYHAAHVGRPALVQLDLRTPQSLYPDLIPEGAYYRMVESGMHSPTNSQSTTSATSQSANVHRSLSQSSRRSSPHSRPRPLSQGVSWSGYEPLMPSSLSLNTHKLDPRTHEQLLWFYYNQALFHAARGDTQIALRATQKGLSLAPTSVELSSLATALRTHHQEAPIDTAPFRVVLD